MYLLALSVAVGVSHERGILSHHALGVLYQTLTTAVLILHTYYTLRVKWHMVYKKKIPFSLRLTDDLHVSDRSVGGAVENPASPHYP